MHNFHYQYYGNQLRSLHRGQMVDYEIVRGDLNHDGKVDHTDLLEIGLHYGKKVPQHHGIEYESDFSYSLTAHAQANLSLNFRDANADFTINALDTGYIRHYFGFEYDTAAYKTQGVNFGYLYDAKGNMVLDGYRKINIQYNHLNLPTKVQFENGSILTNRYLADGSLLSRSLDSSGVKLHQSNYYTDIQFQADSLKQAFTPEGFVQGQEYFYNITDHLGNSRAVLSSTSEVVQEQAYYPYGMPIRYLQNGSVSRYLFGGKEELSHTGLPYWYDHHARSFDSELGRWTSVDELAEKAPTWTAYRFGFNNPINRIDPDGTIDAPIYDTEGTFLGTDDQGLQGKAIVMNKDNFTQGMSHEDALSKSVGVEALRGDRAKTQLLDHYNELKDRPDYDGYLTKEEADNWWLGKTGFPLFVDQSKIDLPDISTASFGNKEGGHFYKNFIWGLSNTGKVYGTLKLTLINANTGTVFIGGESFLDQYDFTMDGRFFRNFATWLGRPGGAKDGKDFFIYGYGKAIVPVKK